MHFTFVKNDLEVATVCKLLYSNIMNLEYIIGDTYWLQIPYARWMWMNIKQSSAPATVARVTTSVLLAVKQHLIRSQKNLRIIREVFRKKELPQRYA